MLQPGSRIAVVAPAGIYDPEGLARGRRLVESWGYETVDAPHLGVRHRYTAGTVEQRAEALTWALTEPGIDAAWFARGGSGTARLLDRLPWDRIDDRVVIGFSDATALFCAARDRAPLRCVHGPVLHSLADLPTSDCRDALRRLLAGDGPSPLPGRQLCGPQLAVQGPVHGGNLSILASLAGTPWAARADGSILLVEEVGEHPYRIDRLLWQLEASGLLGQANAIALGRFVRCPVPEAADWSMDDVLLEVLSGLGVPVVADLPVGHGSDNVAILLGSDAVLSPDGLEHGGTC